jgi:hypothetical protein
LVVSIWNLAYSLTAIFTTETDGFANTAILFILTVITLGTGAINGYLLFVRSKALIKINAAICLLEVFQVFSNGFFYKLTNGSEYVIFLYKDELSHQIDVGQMFDPLNLEFMISWKHSDAWLFGINVIYVIFLFILLVASRGLDASNSAIKNKP